MSRATVDLDFLVEKDDLAKIEKIMKSNGYKCVYKSENVSQYVSDLKIFGEIDFLHAFREASASMLKLAKDQDIFEGRMKIKVLVPEDIIGLKVQALCNDPSRSNQEYLDIEALMNNHKYNLDWGKIDEYFSMFDLKEKFNELKSKYSDVKR